MTCKRSNTLACMRFLPLAAVLLVAACGQQGAPSAQDPATRPVSATTSSNPSSTVSSTAATVSASPSVSHSVSPTASPSARPSGLRGLLLAADELPAAHGVIGWRVEHTGKEGEAPFGSCQLTSLSTIGATSALVRTYDSAAGATAAQLVARFADAKSAWRGLEVLKSWREKCASRLGSGSSVSTLANVGVSPATGHRYLVSSGATTKAFEGFGLVRRGELISLVLFTAQGSTYGYPTGREPEALAVKAIAQLLA